MPIRIVNLDCWHSNSLIYQAEGFTDDGKCVYVRYRRPYFSVGLGFNADEAAGNDVFVSDAHPDHDPSTINLATIREWTAEGEPRITWPDHIDGFANEPEDC